MLFSSVNADQRGVGNSTTLRGADEEAMKNRVMQLASVSGGNALNTSINGGTQMIPKSKITP